MELQDEQDILFLKKEDERVSPEDERLKGSRNVVSDLKQYFHHTNVYIV